MGATSARDRLAGELQKLKDASGLSYTQIETQGRKQTPIVKLGRTSSATGSRATTFPRTTGRSGT